MLDYNTLLVSLGVSTLCLLLTLLGTWMARRGDGFLLTWVIGLFFLVAGIFSYSYYTTNIDPVLGSLCCSLMLIGFAIIHAAGYQFRTGGSPVMYTVVGSCFSIALTVPPMLAGFDGLGFVGLNVGAMLLLLGAAREYWKARPEAPGPLTGMAVLYGVTAASFLLCGLMLISLGQWKLGHAPDNWSENLNVAICIAGMTGIGAMSLMVHQARITALHRHEAMTDGLTGLANRRALFDKHLGHSFTDKMAVIVFDIDRFKSINDQYGHAVGDRVIQALADDLRNATGVVTAARLGGEEFAVVLLQAQAGYAEWVAEKIRRNFADRNIQSGGMQVRATVSAGIAYGAEWGETFEAMLSSADSALYDAKRGGRNRVETAMPSSGDTRTTA
ncbi:GGDEF domain-containing protein [Rhizobium oryzicola]